MFEQVYDQSVLKKPFAMVLEGGGGKGAYEVGVYNYLCEIGMNQNIAAISGSSVGAINLCIFTQPDTNLGDTVWRNIEPRFFLRLDARYFGMNDGLFGREGLIELMDENLDYKYITNSKIPLYVGLSDYGQDEFSEPTARYYKLNGETPERIRKAILASSALPAVYQPVEIDGSIYRDGGLVDNLPIEPLYRDGFRRFLVIGLRPGIKIKYDQYPDAEFMVIKPFESLGDELTGTMDFTKEGARWRIRFGYEDAKRFFQYYHSPQANEPGFDEHMRFLARQTYYDIRNQLGTDDRINRLESMVQRNIDKINELYNL